MDQRKTPKFKLYPNRFKKVTLSFKEPELCGLYTFFVYKVQLPSIKKKIINAGGNLKSEDHNSLHYQFEGEGCAVTVHNLATPHMYKH